MKKDQTKSKKREDDLTRIKAQLLMAGVEQNPGPTGEQTVKLTRYTRWDRELSTWLITYCETMENQLKSRVSLLLSYLDPTATGTKAVYPLIIRILGLSATELKEKYFRNQPNVTEQTIHARLDDHRWNVIISQLNKLLPSLSAEQPEQMLKKMKKEKSETLLEFASRFEAMASTFSAKQLLPSRVAKIFFQKLPKQLQ